MGTGAVSLDGRVAFITGAAAGIGAGIVDLFLACGAQVIALDRSPIERKDVLPVQADVRDRDAIEAAVRAGAEQFGRIDILINNAGIYPRRAFVDMTESEWDEMLDTNLKSVFLCTKAIVPQMIRQGYGRIVNIASIHVFRAGANLSHYTASKSGMMGFTRSLSRELGVHGIHVNCVTPGAVKTEGEVLTAKPGEIEALVAQQSIPRRLLPIDIARVCLFLCCELSDGLTGQTINVDAGRMLQQTEVDLDMHAH
jgi:NAD(P)-dependent dehydrogenase (short-subunit alcohol dehydrogenase family)